MVLRHASASLRSSTSSRRAARTRFMGRHTTFYKTMPSTLRTGLLHRSRRSVTTSSEATLEPHYGKTNSLLFLITRDYAVTQRLSHAIGFQPPRSVTETSQ